LILRTTLAKFRDGSDTFELRLAARVLAGSYLRDHVLSGPRTGRNRALGSFGDDETKSLRARHRLGAPLDTQFGEDALEMRFNRLWTDVEAPGDFLI
jgi:hypothetical protein